MKQPLEAVDGTESAIRIAGTTALFLDKATEGGYGAGRVCYLAGGTGPPLVMVHTVRTQAEHFRHLISLVRDRYTVYALDLPGMGYSEIAPGASYEEPAMRAGVKRLITQLDLRDVTLLGESMGAVLALTTAADLPERVRRVLAVNPYDYAGGIARSGLLARLIVTRVLAPGVGRMIARVTLSALRVLRRAPGSAAPSSIATSGCAPNTRTCGWASARRRSRGSSAPPA